MPQTDLVDESKLNYVVWLSNGILLMNNDTCLKNPLTKMSAFRLQLMEKEMLLSRGESCIVNYKTTSFYCWFKYDKIHHEPLTYAEGKNVLMNW